MTKDKLKQAILKVSAKLRVHEADAIAFYHRLILIDDDYIVAGLIMARDREMRELGARQANTYTSSGYRE